MNPTHVLALVFALNLLARGVGETFAVFLVPFGEVFDYDRAALASVYSVYAILLGSTAPVAGWLFDRHGPRACYLAGLALLSAGCLVASRAESLLGLSLGAGALVGAGSAAVGMVPATALVSRWFERNVGSAMGVAYAGLSAGVMVFALLAERLIDFGGWRFAYTAIGVALACALPLVALAPWRRIAAGRSGTAPVADGADRSGLRAALRSSGFWALAVVFCLTAIAIYSVSVQLVAYLVSLGFSHFEAASAYGAAGALSIFGMLTSGRLSDRFGRRATATVSYLVTLAGIGLVALVGVVPSVPLLACAVMLFGVSAGSRGPIISALCARLFAGAGVAAVFGGLSIGLGIGSALGAWAAGALHDATGGYAAGFWLSAMAALLALTLFHVVPVLRHERREALT